MKRGPKPKPPAVKKNQGSFQPSRGGDLVEIPTVSSIPQPPEWLSPAALTVWNAEISRVTHGSMVVDLDTTMFAIYCNTIAGIIDVTQKGDQPSAAQVSEARKMAEQFGIFGRKSRLITDPGADKTNPFARNGSKNR